MTTIITHDETVFEGLTRPASMLIFRDASVSYESDGVARGDIGADDEAILARYFSDIQNLFLKKFALFAGSDQVSESDSHKMRSLLEEMIKVKSLIEKSAEKISIEKVVV